MIYRSIVYRSIVTAAVLLAVAAILGAPLWLLIPAGALAAVAVRIEELQPRPAHVRYRQTRNRPPCQCRACSTIEAQITRERELALVTHGVVDRQIRRSQLAALRRWNEERYRLNPWLRTVDMLHGAAALYIGVGRMSLVLDAMESAWDEMAEDLGL